MLQLRYRFLFLLVGLLLLGKLKAWHDVQGKFGGWLPLWEKGIREAGIARWLTARGDVMETLLQPSILCHTWCFIWSNYLGLGRNAVKGMSKVLFRLGFLAIPSMEWVCIYFFPGMTVLFEQMFLIYELSGSFVLPISPVILANEALVNCLRKIP